MRKKAFIMVMALSMAFGNLVGCAGASSDNAAYSPSIADDGGSCVVAETATTNSSISYSAEYADCMDGIDVMNTEEYSVVDENGFKSVAKSPLSTFSADVDTASYSNIRRMINEGYGVDDIPDGSVRIEEMVNYFSYNYNQPEDGEPFGVTATISSCPWNEDNELLVLGLQTEAIDFTEAADSNIVFLIDVSGSMYTDNKLPLLKKSFELMLDSLGEKDKVSIVTYAGGDEVILRGVPASNKKTILDAFDSLEAGGSTNGADGIVTAYELAENYFIEGGNNRVILATDGDFNVGISDPADLEKLISEEKESGVFLTVLGFGMGNYKDNRMETLADAGNGNYAYIDDIKEANKVLVEELGANMVTVAKDVKLQVEFNPAYISEYRLVGYDNRVLADEDFEDDTKDAGEVGAGHSVTVIYELVKADEDSTESGLKYQDSAPNDFAKETDEWLTLSVRYKEPDGDESKLLAYPIGQGDYTDDPSDDFIFASSVAEFGMILSKSEYVNEGSLKRVIKKLDSIDLDDEYKEEFRELVDAIRLND